jgi:hypothetical protein
MYHPRGKRGKRGKDATAAYNRRGHPLCHDITYPLGVGSEGSVNLIT